MNEKLVGCLMNSKEKQEEFEKIMSLVLAVYF